MKRYKEFRAGRSGMYFGNGRTHSPEILAGIWKSAANAIQIFAGQYFIGFYRLGQRGKP